MSHDVQEYTACGRTFKVYDHVSWVMTSNGIEELLTGQIVSIRMNDAVPCCLDSVLLRPDTGPLAFVSYPGDRFREAVGYGRVFVTNTTHPPSSVNANSVAVNDHTCPSCRNDKCSKTEKSCWKCGGDLK